jgi:hypothetical protein
MQQMNQEGGRVVAVNDYSICSVSSVEVASVLHTEGRRCKPYTEYLRDGGVTAGAADLKSAP